MKIYAISTCIMALFLATACDTVKAPRVATPDPLPAAAYPQITVLDDLHKYVSYDRPVVRGSSERPMSVTVPVRLRSNKPVNAQYRYVFLGADGTPVRSQMEWKYMLLPARTPVYMDGAALDVDAVDWRLEIRPAH